MLHTFVALFLAASCVVSAAERPDPRKPAQPSPAAKAHLAAIEKSLKLFSVSMESSPMATNDTSNDTELLEADGIFIGGRAKVDVPEKALDAWMKEDKVLEALDQLGLVPMSWDELQFAQFKFKSFPSDPTLGGWNRQIRLLSAVYGWAIRDRKYLSSRPWNARERKVQQTGRPVVWPEQVQAYLAAVDSHSRKTVIRLGIRVQLGLGLRESEAGGARWEWLSWRQEEYLPGNTKNRKTRRIPIPAWLLQLLLAEWNRQGCPTHGLVLPDAKAAQKARGFTKNAIREAGEDIAVPGLHPHRMRATFATTHYEAGTPLSEIQQMMGHEKPITTLKYIEMRQVRAAEAQAKVAAAMGFALGAPSKQEAS